VNSIYISTDVRSAHINKRLVFCNQHHETCRSIVNILWQISVAYTWYIELTLSLQSFHSILF